MLKEICIKKFTNSSGTTQDIFVSYQLFGRGLQEAPIVLVNHALTGNSQVTGENGWWKEIVGAGKCIDTNHFAVLAFNIPGNGFTGKAEHLIKNYKDFTLRDIAKIQLLALEKLKVQKLFAIIGGSIGGALAWEMAVLKPKLAQHIIPIATDYKATDWVIANCEVQEQILNNSSAPVKDARMHAMTFYRTPQSLSKKFNREKEEQHGFFKVGGWLKYHGDKLEQRFQLSSYKLVNHLLTTIDISNGSGKYVEAAAKIEADIHMVAVNTDYFFLAEENWDTYVNLSFVKKNVHIHEIKSIHGHDAFLIENAQLSAFLKPIFKTEKIQMKEINIVLFGIGNVGKTVIPQLLSAKEQWEKEAGIKLKIPVIANSTKALFKAKGITKNWKEDFSREGASYSITDVLNFIAENKLENTIAVDATASKDFVGNYLNLIKNGFHIVAANKIANTISTDFYQKLREELSLHKKLFLYETNVGAGLPVVETVKNLYKSGEKITKIRGVFSGSLSYIFNRFSEEEDFLFSKILLEAGEKGYTEPDAREDLSGNDVGRKLLVLARELQLQKEFEEIDIQSLIPEQLNGKTSAEEFKNRITELDDFFSLKKSGQNQNSVLRYIGEIDVESGKLEAKLISEPKSSPLGQLKGADNLVEIFTESYAENPLVIQGAGAGAAVTARGVVSDILKIAEKLNF